MDEIDPNLASHKLNVIVTANPVRQKIRPFHLDRHQIIQTKVDNLLSASFYHRGEVSRMACKHSSLLKEGW